MYFEKKTSKIEISVGSPLENFGPVRGTRPSVTPPPPPPAAPMVVGVEVVMHIARVMGGLYLYVRSCARAYIPPLSVAAERGVQLHTLEI